MSLAQAVDEVRQRPLAVPLWLRWGRKGLAAILDQATLSLSGFVLTIALARTVPPAAYGAFSLALSVSVLVLGLHNALLIEPMSVLGPARHAGRLDWYGEQLQKMNGALTLPIACIIATAGLLMALGPGGREVGPALMAMAAAMPLALSFGVVRRFFYLRANPWGAWMTTTAYGLTMAVGLVLLAATGRLSPVSAFVLTGLASVAAILTSVPKLRGSLSQFRPGAPDLALGRQHWTYGRWILAASLVYWLSTEAYFAFTAWFLGLEDTGALRALQNLISPAIQIVAAVNILVLPWAAGKTAAGDTVRVKRTLTMVSLILVGGMVLYGGALVWLRVPVIRILYSGRYMDRSWLIPWLAAIPVIVALASGPQVLTRALQRPQAILMAYGASAIVACSAGLYLTARWGLLGAAIGLLTSYFVYLCALCLCAGFRAGAA